MSSKPKSKTFIVHHRGKSITGNYTVLGRYRIGARNEAEAESLLRSHVGKHAKVRVYYEDKKIISKHGAIIQEC